MSDKFYEVLFWSGFLLSIIAFLYKPVLIFVGGFLMIVSLLREFLKIKRIKKADIFVKRSFKLHKIFLFLFLASSIVYLLYTFLGLMYSLLFLFILFVIFLAFRFKGSKKVLKVNEFKIFDKKKIVILFCFFVIFLTIVYIIFYRFGIGVFFYLVILFGLILLFFILFMKKEIKGISIKKKESKYETDLDRLLNLVMERKKVSIREIAKAFNIKYELAEEWCKILEDGGLAFLFYPPFGDAEIRSAR